MPDVGVPIVGLRPGSVRLSVQYCSPLEVARSTMSILIPIESELNSRIRRRSYSVDLCDGYVLCTLYILKMGTMIGAMTTEAAGSDQIKSFFVLKVRDELKV